MKILLCDDDIFSIQIMDAILSKKANNTFFIATDGKQAIDIMRHIKDFDLIILDLYMPEMDGFEAIKILRQELKLNTPILVISADKDSIQKTIALGADGFLQKPVNPNAFMDAITEVTKINA